MAYRALFGALAAIFVCLMPAMAGSENAPERNQDTVAAAKPALPDEIPAPVAAPRAAQIEPVMVAPVKRVAPRIPDIKTPDATIKQAVTIEKDPTLEQKTSSGNKKSCGAGTKRNGNGCTKVAANKPSGKKRR